MDSIVTTAAQEGIGIWEVLVWGEKVHLSHCCPAAEGTSPAHQGSSELLQYLSGLFFLHCGQSSLSLHIWQISSIWGQRFLNWFSVRWRNDIKRRTWNSSLSICMAVKPPMTTWHFAFLTQHFKATPESLSAGKLDFATWKVSTKEVVSYFRVILQVALRELLRSLGEK